MNSNHLYISLSTLSFLFLLSFAGNLPLPLQLTSLLSLKSSFADPLNHLNDWNISKQHWCNWSGVKCDRNTDKITALDISNRNLSGHIPTEIRYLCYLRLLNFSGNTFEGPLPSAVFDLINLKVLDISYNQFNSTFPPNVSNLSYLRYFNAYNNNFTGPLPEEITRLQFLEVLKLGGSFFSGDIPAAFGNFSALKFLHLSGNRLTGRIPSQLGSLATLEHLEIGYQKIAGCIPSELVKLSNLQYLDISTANLSGEMLPELGNLTKLETLILFKNSFTGRIPESLGQLQSLKFLDMSDNKLSGTIPGQLSLLKQLKLLHLMNNELTGEIPEGIGALPNLCKLDLWNNSLSGFLPQNLGQNGKLEWVDVSTNSLSGPIPPNLCFSNKLRRLSLFSNRFYGEMPSSLANCSSLYRVQIENNRLNGSIPSGFGNLPNLDLLDMSQNNFSGHIPDFGDAEKLEHLNISDNSFHNELPRNIWSAPSLKVFAASSSKITGSIPKFVGCQNFYQIELDENDLTGNIPWNIGHCEKLNQLNLRSNSLTGIIPWEIASLPSIAIVDLSHNFLTGTIPSSFGNCSTLESFDVSYNQLTGPIPSTGITFSSFQWTSFTGNDGLCGEAIAKPCRTEGVASGDAVVHPKKKAGAIVWITAAAFGILLFLLIAGIRYQSRRFDGGKPEIGPWKLTAFQRLNFTADDVVECLSMTLKIIGMGSTGTVYKADLPSGEIIAVKKLWARGMQKETIRRQRGVLAEVEVLGNVRHRNIVRLLGCCSNAEFTMLLYEYMPNGSLDDLLHGKNKLHAADWLTRYKIALGVAQGICYLHHDCHPVIVHRDLKPSNILLDGQMEARVADFGLAKLIHCDESMSVIAGSYGYIAPEYAYTLQVDEKSDIYSFGVVLLEIISGKRSVAAEFGDGNSIVDWVRFKIKAKDGIKEVLDENAGASCSSVRDEMLLLLKIALLCTSKNPAERPSMRDVVSKLLEARPERKSSAKDGGKGVEKGGD